MSFLALWFGVMFPLVFSPGPANIVFAASGSTLGLKRSLPLLCGIDLIFILKSILIGFGFGSVINRYPAILHLLQFVGAAYIIYLAIGFLSSGTSSQQKKTKTLGFKDGLIIQLLNAKGWVMVVLMFSLFTAPAQQLFGDLAIISLVILLAMLNIATHLIWISTGELITRFVARESSQKIQAYGYFFSLVSVAGWLLVDNPYWYQ